MNKINKHEKNYFEYKSNKSSKFPLVHIVIPNRAPRNVKQSKIPVARGILAFGKVSQGIVSIGLVSHGIISLGLICFGVIAGGPLAIGGLLFGFIALGILSIGNLASGAMAIGNFCFGYSSIGNIATGKYALGNIAQGKVALSMGNNPSITQIKNYLKEMVDYSRESTFASTIYKIFLNILESPIWLIIFILSIILFLLIILTVYRIHSKKNSLSFGGMICVK
ncbi:hypothetical protein IV487_14415 [Enterococcus saccharolyticus]|uniref:hypothetical protein n=1 Tax=Enterococcus TaxID=1350 RepID=UPI001E5379FF|nr:hypothetical protein [Enterococcus saccharolyticus]MCD5003655.1 hypothetical protein [Enterococcus saccharolyticus]